MVPGFGRFCFSLSYRDLEEMMAERGVEVDHSTFNRWVLKYAPELDKRIRPHLNPANDSWRMDETYIEIRGEWKYLYRAVDSDGNTLDFMLSAKRDHKTAVRLFPQSAQSSAYSSPSSRQYGQECCLLSGNGCAQGRRDDRSGEPIEAEQVLEQYR